jgi:hypothetical protein
MRRATTDAGSNSAVFAVCVSNRSAAHAERAEKRLAPSILIGRVTSGDRPIVESEVTLYGLVGQCIPDPCLWVNVPVARARTDDRGFFSIDLAQAGAEVRNAIADKSVVIREQPRPGWFYLVATGGRVGRGATPR